MKYVEIYGLYRKTYFLKALPHVDLGATTFYCSKSTKYFFHFNTYLINCSTHTFTHQYKKFAKKLKFYAVTLTFTHQYKKFTKKLKFYDVTLTLPMRLFYIFLQIIYYCEKHILVHTSHFIIIIIMIIKSQKGLNLRSSG